ncbi:redoxin domain-containing protein [Xanthomonas sp. XNM01]|uniref:redoxin domain-containing protein n=1 Tax=Xanthomonas sp. XNM01 TaxID=2769289 RepID=UPI00177AE0EC|nr:redoxin domain-containing protein [Xanthomonas sp. XNM01]MBD9367954.1 redoxin domain-containing protein [Xanthomonas sp. XNM01]
MSAVSLQELPELAWLNAPATTLHDLRGRPVVLAFVNAASTWCAQRLTELSQWQARNPGRVQVLAVQVPRFDSERVPQRALKLLRRSGVRFPVLLDADWAAWQRYGIDAWPTVLLIDAQGREQARIVGLGNDLERQLIALCEGLPRPLDEDLSSAETHAEPRLPLLFPGGIAASGDRLYVADSGHHRVLECNHHGRVLRQFGMGTADFIDGPGDHAAFNRPLGLALEREALYVADAGNHALRRINLGTGQVDTLCGNGRAGDPVEGAVAADARGPLSHPLALAVASNHVYIAMAGDNRIWSYDLGRNELVLRAGTGQLDLRDGNARMAAFAQPVGVAAVQQVLYVCDALGSAVRSLQLRTDLVQTLVGQGFWDFGDEDGPRSVARLQHPQAIALSADAPLLWIADSGNGGLRTLRLGGGELGTVALPRRLHGPSALAIAAGSVWIAETDAHGILRYDIASGSLEDVSIGE